MLQTKSLKRRLVIAFMAISLVFTMATLVRGQPSKVRVGVFTPGISLEDVRDGLQQGLTRLGYLEVKNITFIVEDTKGNSVDLALKRLSFYRPR